MSGTVPRQLRPPLRSGRRLWARSTSGVYRRQTTTMQPGSENTNARWITVVKPRGQWHTYWNAGASELRLMELLVPGGFEGCLERLAEALAARVPLEVGTLERIGAEYGVEFDFASVSDLCQHFGVTLARWPQRGAGRHVGEKHGQHDSVRRPRE